VIPLPNFSGWYALRFRQVVLLSLLFQTLATSRGLWPWLIPHSGPELLSP
jgi:hypothetical protein